MSITWSDVAEADLDDLYDYIARDVPYYAEQFIDKLIDIIYLVEAEHVHVLTVIHGSWDVGGQARKPWEVV